jgi:lipopolysaccharide exporter
LTLFMHGDDLFVGKLLGVVALGFYTMAYKIGNMITTELVDSLRRVFFPAFSSLQNNIAMLRRAYLTTYHITTAIGGVFSVGLFWLAPEFVSVLLGEKWLPVIPVLRVLAIWGGVQMLSTNTAPLFRAVGRPDWWAKVQALKFSLLAVLIYPLSVKFGILGTAFAVLIASSLEIPVGLWWTREALVCKWRDLLQPILLSLIGTLSVSVIYVIMGTMLDFSDFLHLLFYAPMLLGFYIITVYFVDKWLNMGALASVRIALSG